MSVVEEKTRAGWRAGLVASAAALALLAAACSAKPSFPDWAYPGDGKGAATTPALDAELLTIPRSDRSFPRRQLQNFHLAVADWFPADHPTAPDIVVTPKGDLPACGYCHLPGGEGRPENAALAGLPADYIKGEIAAFRSGDRNGAKPAWLPTSLMVQEARKASDADVAAAADYFSKLRYQSRFRVIETKTISRPAEAGFLLSPGSGPKERLGERILEEPVNREWFERRDPQATFIAYVPEGSLGRGEALAASGGPAKQPCSACHGSDLRGGEGLPGPPLAGRAPAYLFRQLYAFQTGARKGAAAEPMRVETEKLSQADMVDLAAYLTSLPAR